MKKIELIINNKKVICLKKEQFKPHYNTVIILTGASTYASVYFIFAKQFKKTEVIIINTPGHGLGNSLTEGEPLTDGNELVDFQVTVIKQLIKENHCTSKITLLGYSLGGMTLLNIVNRNLLDENVGLCVLIASARITKHDNEVIKGLYNKETNTFNTKSLMEKNCTNKTPWYIKYLNPKWLFALPTPCYADFLQCDSMNEISKNELMVKNNKNIIAFLGENDFFFSEKEILKTIKFFKQRTFISLEDYGHLFLLERPIKAGKLVFKAIKEVDL
ncbi:alpha/beta hydrolase [Clostridium bowmanii]|uniref:alpha/beta hydrolase n=1 Tax=Clostridium bowmanii TaxID=132925 RepID=UPI001C0B4DCA|nr:alpha/beta hydrolase [Clostridium bowmanii]MBU3190451.1 alpha/beta hydrolase [Clostridium bowmanii]MCA1074487.1 alpha/beta hydrolase [Clostridium bowmanii]